MADANNPQGGSPSSPGHKDKVLLPVTDGPGTFRPTPPLQKDGDFDVSGRLTSQNRNHLRQTRVDGIRKKESLETDAPLLEAKRDGEKKLFLVESLLKQLEKSSWEVSELPEKQNELLKLKRDVDAAKNVADFLDLNIRIEYLRMWAENELKEIEKTEILETIEKRLYKGEKRRWFNRLDVRARRLKGTPGYQHIQNLLDNLAWLQVDEKCDAYTGDSSKVEANLSEIEQFIEDEEGELTKALIAGKTNQKIAELRKIERLIADFNNKKVLLVSMLLHPATAKEKASTEKLLTEIESLKTPLSESNDINGKEVGLFTEKVARLGSVIDTLQALIDSENKQQESMMSWHAEWPKEIKYVDAKKPNPKKPGMQGERGGWKKDGQLLKDQAIWSRLNAQALRVFKRYNDLIDKALGSGKDGEVKDLVAIKEAVINALYADKTTDAAIELTRLEKQIEARKDEVENLVETKELTVKFEGVIKTLERLTSIAPLEKNLLEAKKEELKGLKLELDKEETKKDSAKTKELLRIFRAILSELTSAVEEKDKEAKKEAAERLTEFKQLSRALESLKTKVNHSLPSEISDEDKQELKKKILDTEEKAKGFSESETKKEAEKSREILTLFKTSLDKLTETVQKKINSVKKAVERKNSETEDFNKAVDVFEELQFVINDLENVSSDEQRSFARLVNELEEIKKSRSQEKDKGQLDQKSLLFRTLLGELASFVIKKLGNEDSIRRTITQLKEKLANATSQSLKDDILAKIKLNEKTLEKIQALKESKDSTAPRKKVLRAITNGATVFLREKDPLTGKPREVSVSNWRELQKSSTEVSTLEKGGRRSQAEEELRAIHKDMWLRNPEGYKKLYVERKWAADEGSQLLRKIVTEILGEKIASVDEKLTSHQKELDERNALVRRQNTDTLTLDEEARLETLETLLSPWIKEKESLTENIANYPYEEQLRMMREQEGKRSELMDQRQIYSPKDDRAMDLYPVYGVTGEEFRKKGLFSIFRKNSEAQQKYQIAKHAADQESASSKRGSIPGFTKTAINPTPLAGRMPDPITERDLVAEGGEGLAAVAYKQPKIKIGSEESMPNVAGMVRSVAKEDLSYQRNRDAVMIKPETGKILEEERATFTQEEQERRMTRVNSILSTLTKHAKSWRTWALVGTIAVGLGAPIIAFAGTENTTLEQTLSWKDLLRSMSEREQATLGNFINDLT